MLVNIIIQIRMYVRTDAVKNAFLITHPNHFSVVVRMAFIFHQI